MRRISTPTAAQDLFGPGKHGFRNGDPANAILATRLQAEWFNAVQEEVATAIEQSGTQLAGESNDQLSLAIESVVDRKAPVATKAEAEVSDESTADNVKRMTPLRVLQAIKARLINATEAVVGMLRVGTQAEVNDGGLDDVAVTPKKLRAGFAVSLTTNGYIALPSWLGGLIIQWGTTATLAGDTVHDVNLPLAFPTAGLAAFITSFNPTASVYADNACQVKSLTQTKLTIWVNVISTNQAASPCMWLAFGK